LTKILTVAFSTCLSHDQQGKIYLMWCK